MKIKWTEKSLDKHYLKHGDRFNSKDNYKRTSEQLINKQVGKNNVWGSDNDGIRIRYDLNKGVFVKAIYGNIVTCFRTNINYYLKMISNKSHKRQHDI